MGDITVTLATEDEAPACLALIREVQGLPAEFLIARHKGQFAGAAAVVWRSWSKPGGFPTSIQVLPDRRRKGVGRALISAAASLATGEASGLWSLNAAPQTGPVAQFMRACGFAERRRQHHYIADVEDLLQHIAPRVARLRARGRIPAQAQIIPLDEAPMDHVAWLVSAEFGGGPVRALQRLHRRGGPGGASRRDRSLAVMDGGQVAGVLLCRVKDGVGVVDGWVTAPAWRNGWTNLVLLEAILTRGKVDGYEAFRFHCDDTVLDTMKLARRSRATEVARDALFYYPIAAS